MISSPGKPPILSIFDCVKKIPLVLRHERPLDLKLRVVFSLTLKIYFALSNWIIKHGSVSADSPVRIEDDQIMPRLSTRSSPFTSTLTGPFARGGLGL